MNERLGAMAEALAKLAPLVRSRRAAVEPISQVILTLNGQDKDSVFRAAQNVILTYAGQRASGELPNDARIGNSFSVDEVGARRIEGVAIQDPRYWTLRFDDDDRYVAARSWVIETALAKQDADNSVLFGIRLQCIARGENPPYDRTIPRRCP